MRVDDNPVQVCARDGQPHALVRADGNQHRRKALIENVIQVCYRSIEAQFNAQVGNVRHLALDDPGRQTEFGHAQAQHPTRHRHGLEDGDGIALADNILRSGQSARPGAEDGNALIKIFDFDLFHRLARLGINFIGDEALEGADVDRLIHLGAIASRLAAMVTDTPANAREGIVHFDDAQRVRPTSLANQSDVALGALMSGAGVAAGRDAALLDGESVRHRLRVEFIGRAAWRKPLIERIRDNDRAHFDAVAAGDALAGLDIARLAQNRDGEIARLSRDAFDFGIGQDFDIRMAPSFDQPRRDGAHGAVVGRESFIQLCHVSADGRLLLDEIDLEALFGQIERGLHPRDATANDQHGADGQG